MGFEPTRAEHNGLAVHRLNHSATLSSHIEQESDVGGIEGRAQSGRRQSLSPPKYRSRPHSSARSSKCGSRAGSPASSRARSPASLRVPSPLFGGQPQAISLNDIINNGIELEHFKVSTNLNSPTLF